MVLMHLAWFHVPIEPAVNGLEGNAKLLGELRLAELAFEAVDLEPVNQILRHGGSRL